MSNCTYALPSELLLNKYLSRSLRRILLSVTVEYDENVYGLATTNMLIHGDGNSNIERGSCFDLKEWIKRANPDVILMNPPYNAQKKHMPNYYTNTWNSDRKEDPTKGLYFVKYISDIINELGKQARLSN